MFWKRFSADYRRRNPRVVKTPCPPHVWGDGPDIDHRACVKCGKIVKPVWVEPYRAPPLNPDDVEVVMNGGRIIHIPTGIGVSSGEGPGPSGFYQLPDAWWNELAIRVEAHIKAQSPASRPDKEQGA